MYWFNKLIPARDGDTFNERGGPAGGRTRANSGGVWRAYEFRNVVKDNLKFCGWRVAIKLHAELPWGGGSWVDTSSGRHELNDVS